MLDTSQCDTYLQEVREFAESIGLAEQLQKQLDLLGSYGGVGVSICKLYKDFAPHSFSFNMQWIDERRRGFGGGLIYQGPVCPADGSFPSLTVSLAKGTGWFCHT